MMQAVKNKAFTLIEVLLSLAISIAAITLVWMTFANIVKATQRGEASLENLHHGEYALEQIISAMRSAVFFTTDPKQFEFTLEDNGSSDNSADIVSWVTSSAAFMPIGSPLANSLHRIILSIEDDKEGDPSLAITAYPYLFEPESEEAEGVDFWIVSRKIRGLDCNVYDLKKDEWVDEWENKNNVPRFVAFTLYMDPLEGSNEPTHITKSIAVPLGTYALSKYRNIKDESDELEEESAGINGSRNINNTQDRNRNNTTIRRASGDSSNSRPLPAGGGARQ